MADDKKQKYLKIFREEADEHLKNLNEGLLELEKNPERADLIQVLLRSAHTLKGSARMLGLEEIGTIAHKMEDIFKDVEKGELAVESGVMDLLFEGTDSINQLVSEMTSGKKPTVNVKEYEARVTKTREAPVKKKARKPGPEKETKDESEAAEELESRAEPSGQAPKEEPLKAQLDTIRVEAGRMDQLVNLAGELILNKNKLETRSYRSRSFIEELDQILGKWQEYFVDGHREEGRRKLQELRVALQGFHQEFSEDLIELDYNTQEMQTHALSLRMLPISTLFEEFPRFVRDVARDMGKKIELNLFGGETELDRRMLEELRGPLIHLIRNCCDHGIEAPDVRKSRGKAESGTIDIRAYPRANGVVIEVSDDGQGMDVKNIREVALKRNLIDPEAAEEMSDEEIIYLTLLPGFSTSAIITDLSGRGVGLDVVKSNLENLRGDLWIETWQDKGTRVTMEVPLTLAIINCLLVTAGDEIYAIPLNFVEESLRMQLKDLKTERNKEVVSHRGQVITVVHLLDLLGLPEKRILRPMRTHEDYIFLVILRFRQQKLALAVDTILRDQEVIVKTLGSHLKSVQYISGATILREGEPALILNVFDIFQAAEGEITTVVRKKVEAGRPARKILVIDDSITSRIVEKNILERAGYQVDLAVDGQEALDMIETADYHLFVVDIEMPRIDGFELTRRLREIEKTQEVPVIIITSRASDQDKRTGIKVGAQAYIVKKTFDQDVLLETVKRLIGE